MVEYLECNLLWQQPPLEDAAIMTSRKSLPKMGPHLQGWKGGFWVGHCNIIVSTSALKYSPPQSWWSEGEAVEKFKLQDKL